MNTIEKQLVTAAEFGDTKTLRSLLDSGANIEYTNKHGWNALITASGMGRTESVKLLLDCDANIDHQTNTGLTALIWASERGFTEIVRLLLKYGADMEHKDRYGDTAMSWALFCNYSKIVELLEAEKRRRERNKHWILTTRVCIAQSRKEKEDVLGRIGQSKILDPRALALVREYL